LQKLWKGETKHQQALKNLQAVEDLGLKTVGKLGAQYDTLVKNIEIALASGLVYTASLEPLAKKALKLAEITGDKLSPTIRALAGDYLGLAEEAGTLEIAVGALSLRLGDLTPNFMRVQKSVDMLRMNFASGIFFMGQFVEASKRTNIMLRTEAEKLLTQKLMDYDTLMQKWNDNSQLTIEGEKKLVSDIIALYKFLGIALDDELEARAAAIGLDLGKLTGLEKFQAGMEKVGAITETVVGGMDTIFNQFYQNQMQRIDNEYQRRKEAIDESMASDQEKYFAIEKLDREMDKKRLAAKKKQAMATKVTSMMEATVHTARAVAEALPDIPLSIIVGGLGAVQIALIAAQPLPSFAEGGIAGLHGPEVIMVGERGPERITPVGKEGVTTSVEFNAIFQITALEPLAVRDVVRDRVGPEFIEWVRLNKTNLLEALDME